MVHHGIDDVMPSAPPRVLVLEADLEECDDAAEEVGVAGRHVDDLHHPNARDAVGG